MVTNETNTRQTTDHRINVRLYGDVARTIRRLQELGFNASEFMREMLEMNLPVLKQLESVIARKKGGLAMNQNDELGKFINALVAALDKQDE